MSKLRVSLVFISLLFVISCVPMSFCGSVPSRLDFQREDFMSYIQDRSVLINVECKVTLPFTDQEREKMGIPKVLRKAGSGTIVRSSVKGSYIATANHVVSGGLFLECDKFSVLDSRGDRHSAVVVTSDAVNDIAFIKIDKNMRISTPIASRSFIGQRILVAGFPHIGEVPNYVYSKESVSITEGVVATHMFSSDGVMNVFRFTAPVYFGSSGGGVFDDDGNLLGVTSFLIGVRVDKETIPRDGNYFARAYTKLAKILPPN